MKTELHKNLQDDQILNVDRQITPNATLFYVDEIGKYCYAGDRVCFLKEKLSGDSNIIDEITPEAQDI